MSGRSVIWGVAYYYELPIRFEELTLGKMSLNFLLFRLNACDFLANSRFWSSVVLTAPAVILWREKNFRRSALTRHSA